MLLNMYEIFDELAAEQSVIKRKEILRKHDSPVLRQVLQGAFHPSIRFSLKRRPAYKPSLDPDGLSYVKMGDVMDRIYIWVEGSTKTSPNITPEKKEHLLIEVLEAMEKREAEVLLNMMEKDLRVKFLTPKLVEDVFGPGFIH